MSMCDRCGTALVPGSTFCRACGMPMTISPAFAMVPPAGTQRAMIGATPLWQAFVGLFMIIVGVIALSVSSFFAPIAGIIILMGAVFLILGLLGKPLFTQQVVYQTAPAPSVYQAGAVKRCPQCGVEIMSAALICYKCGASL